MATTEAPFSFTTKFNGDLLTVRGETIDEFADRIAELASDPRISDALGDLQMVSGVVAVKQQMGGSVVSTTQQQPVAAAQPAGPEVVTGKYGDKWTYGLLDAPDLPDGRGKYVLREWTDKANKARIAFVDPAKGPKPFSPGAEEAKIIWK